MRRLRSFSPPEERFLIERLKQEWQETERAMKRHEAVSRAKTAGKMFTNSLLTLGLLGGVVLIAAVAPNAFAAYGKLFGGTRYYERRAFEKQFRYLRTKKYVSTERTDEGYHVTLTARGKNLILRDAAHRIRIREEKKWDGTWWVVMFDIPRRHNAARNALRERLKTMGMEAMQNSVFISRYPCREEVWFAARMLNVGQYIQIAHVDSLEGYG